MLHIRILSFHRTKIHGRQEGIELDEFVLPVPKLKPLSRLGCVCGPENIYYVPNLRLIL
jgi:hypothetical protein